MLEAGWGGVGCGKGRGGVGREEAGAGWGGVGCGKGRGGVGREEAGGGQEGLTEEGRLRCDIREGWDMVGVKQSCQVMHLPTTGSYPWCITLVEMSSMTYPIFA